MPSGNLPNSGSLGDPQITNGDYQTQINQLLSYVRSLKAEVDALSGTEIKEGAVRGVGNGAGLLADKATLDARLGTGGNLGSSATLNYGTGDNEVVLSARLTEVTQSVTVAANDSESQFVGANSEGEGWYFNAVCTSDNLLSVRHGVESPSAGQAGAYMRLTGDVNVVIVNNTASSETFQIRAFRIDF